MVITNFMRSTGSVYRAAAVKYKGACREQVASSCRIDTGDIALIGNDTLYSSKLPDRSILPTCTIKSFKADRNFYRTTGSSRANPPSLAASGAR